MLTQIPLTSPITGQTAADSADHGKLALKNVNFYYPGNHQA